VVRQLSLKQFGDGRKAAIQIAAKAGIVLPSEKLSSDKKMSYSDFMIRKSKRVKINPAIAGDHLEFNAESAFQEASRCLFCGDVFAVCWCYGLPRIGPIIITLLKRLKFQFGKLISVAKDASFEIESYLKIQQKYQVLNVADFLQRMWKLYHICPTKGKALQRQTSFLFLLEKASTRQKRVLLSETMVQ